MQDFCLYKSKPDIIYILKGKKLKGCRTKIEPNNYTYLFEGKRGANRHPYEL